MNKFSPFSLFIIGVAVLSFFARIVWLTSLSPVISHDELYYVVQAKSIAMSGKDPSGLVSPLQLKPANPLYAELPGLVMAPAAFLFSSAPVFAARFTHVIIGTLLTFVLGYIAYQLFWRKDVAVFTILVGSVNPWIFQNSRMGFDALLSVFFYCLGIAFFLSRKKWRLWWSFLSLVIGFYQYQGLKVIFPPIVFGLVMYDVFSQRQPLLFTKVALKQYAKQITFLFFSAVFFLIYLLRLRSSVAKSRVGDLIFFDQQTIESRVNLERQQSLSSELTSLMSNKLSVLSKLFIEKYLSSFDVNQLFLHIDARRNPYAVWSMGMFYVIDALLIMVGFAWLVKQKKSTHVMGLLLFLVAISPLPSAINAKDTWMMFRSSFLIPWLVLFSALGLSTLLRSRYKLLFVSAVGVYVLFVFQFGYEYFFRYPIYGTTGTYFGERVMVSYASRQKSEKSVVVLAEEPPFVYESVLAFANLVNSANLSEIQQSFRTDQYKVKNIEVTSKCFAPSQVQADSIYIVDARVPMCEKEVAPTSGVLSIDSLIDAGGIYTIYNDSLCSGFQLSKYPVLKSRNGSIESLSDQAFCESYISH